MNKPIQISNSHEVIIAVQPRTETKTYKTYEDYCDHLDKVPSIAAKEIFEQLHDEGCIAFWLELTKLIKAHCIKSDEDNAKYGIEIPPEGHFRKFFNDTVKE